MATSQITCYRGISPQDVRVFLVDPLTTLAEVRQRLTNDGFLMPDQMGIAYRFVAMQSQASTLQDAIVQMEVEKLVPLVGVLSSRGQLICTNIQAPNHPDLVGLATTRFVDRYLSVEIRLNNNDPGAEARNNAIQAVQPMLLTNVKPMSNRALGIYDHVCICVEGSVIGFNLTCWGGAGFQFYIAPEAGEPIVNADLNVCYGDNLNQFCTTSLYRYANRPQTIEVMGSSSLGIGGGETIRYQKVTFKARNIRSYSQNGRVYASSAEPPLIEESTESAGSISAVPGASISPGAMGSGSTSQPPFNLMTDDWSRAGASIASGTPVAPGQPHSSASFGPIYNVMTDDWSRALGEVVVYFFVFPTWQMATRVLGGLNVPNRNL